MKVDTYMKGTGARGQDWWGKDWNGDTGLEEGTEKTVYVCCGLARVATNVHASGVEETGGKSIPAQNALELDLDEGCRD